MPHIFLVVVYFPYLYLFIYYALVFSLFDYEVDHIETWQLYEVTAGLWCTVLPEFMSVGSTKI
jgi:hypothetical protein